MNRSINVIKPSEKYHQIVQQPGFVIDPAQAQSMLMLDRLQDKLTGSPVEHMPWWKKLMPNSVPAEPLQGLYFWGGVGRGKTFIMDVFFQCLPLQEKKRIHFHDFMNQVHQSLKQLRDQENPLRTVAVNLSKSVKVLCLDEFVISDIGDAMIMTGLLEALFQRGVVLVTTSNAAPENLYYDGLQRARFLPAIELINENCQVVHLDSGQDYRLQGLRQTHLYSVPHGVTMVEEVNRYLKEHVTPVQNQSDSLNINGRGLTFEYCAEDTVWFSFSQICETNRSQNDYLEIARLFNTLILTDIPIMDQRNDDAARRFVLLIDVLYDHRVIVIASAAAAAGELYQGRRLDFEFQRTASRLIEMQSNQYLANQHTAQ